MSREAVIKYLADREAKIEESRSLDIDQAWYRVALDLREDYNSFAIWSQLLLGIIEGINVGTKGVCGEEVVTPFEHGSNEDKVFRIMSMLCQKSNDVKYPETHLVFPKRPEGMCIMGLERVKSALHPELTSEKST